MSEPDKDQPYDDLIQLGIVLDTSGKCFAEYNGLDSILYAIGVKSERGTYRVWISNLQKMIRRGKKKEAVTSMIECVETGQVFQTNTINRLAKIIVSEDIGLAYPTLPIWTAKWIRAFEQLKPDDELKKKQMLLMLVDTLVDSPKSRLVDTMFCIYRDFDPKITFDQAFEDLKQAIEDGDLKRATSSMNACIEQSQSLKQTIRVGDLKKRQQIYLVWKYLLDYSHSIQLDVNLALMGLYSQQETNGGRKLNILQAMLNVMYNPSIDWTTPLPGSLDLVNPLAWHRDTSIWPWSISYDKHSLKHAESIGRGRDFFFQYGCVLANRTKEKWLLDTEEEVLQTEET